jgi:hypothetical protein
MGGMRNVCSILVGNSEEKRKLEFLGVDQTITLKIIISKHLINIIYLCGLG